MSEQIHIHIDMSGDARNPIGSIFDKRRYIAVGFGTAVIQKDGETIFDGERGEEFVSMEQAEKQIEFNSTSDYVLTLEAPLWDAKWRRNQDGDWVCFEAGMGFA